MPANKKLLILPGDGIGPEVMREVRRVIDWMDRRRMVSFDVSDDFVGGASIDAKGAPITDDTMQKARDADAILFGSVGGPKWDKLGFDMRPEIAILRLRKELADARAYSATAFARDILSVADNLSRALAAIPADLRADEKMKGLVTGLEATGRELESVFRKNGVEKFVSVGEPLDPNKHQAMMELPSDQEPGTVVQEMQAGYMIKDRLLRPALVGVAKKPD